jgi:hypothetical protein
MPTTNRVDLAAIRTEGSGLPNRYILHAVEGWGKTSFGAKFPKPIFIQSRGETGLQTLIDANQLPATPHFPESHDWQNILGIVEALTNGDHDYKTLVIDTLNGVERLCHEYVCQRDFGGEWGDKGFASYQKGPEVSLSEWRLLLLALDKLREVKKMTIVCLFHTKVQKFSNPEGADFDRYQPDVDKRTWSFTGKWADVVLFGNFESAVTAVKENKKTGEQKGKGVGGQVRMIYTERHAAYDAKNRLGLPNEIPAGESSDETWANFKNAVMAARTKEIAS